MNPTNALMLKLHFFWHTNCHNSDTFRSTVYWSSSGSYWISTNINLTLIGPCIANIFAQFNQHDATFHNLFIFVRRSTCFRRFFRPSSGAQNCTYSVRPILLPAASLAWLAAGSSIGLTYTWRCMCSFELLMMDGKTVWNMYSVLQK